MDNTSTKEKARQVQKIPAYPLHYLDGHRIYRRIQGENWQTTTYLEREPKGGGKGKAMSETKQATNLKGAIKRLRYIIRANFGYNSENEAHITLTYKGSMQDTEKLKRDLQVFLKRLRRGYPNHTLDYVAVMEPHGHGGWHIHLLLKSDRPVWLANGVDDYLCYDKVREMWRAAIGGGGGTRHERLPEDVTDLGRYFGAYFDTAIPEDVELSGDREAIKKASKAAVKGSRLHFYPADFKFYRTSKGIIRPKSVKCFFDYEEMKSGFRPTYTAHYAIAGEDGTPTQFAQTTDWKRKEVN